MASTRFSVIALLALTCPFASGDRDRQQGVVEVADRGHFRQSQQETNKEAAATGSYGNMEGQSGNKFDPHGKGNATDGGLAHEYARGGDTTAGEGSYDANNRYHGADGQFAKDPAKASGGDAGKDASPPGTPETLLDDAKVTADVKELQVKIDEKNKDGWKTQDEEEARKQLLEAPSSPGGAGKFQGEFKDLHKELKKEAMEGLNEYETTHHAGSYKNFAGEVMSLKPERATELVTVAGQVEESNFAANKASNDYTKHLEKLSSNLAGIHDLMGAEASFGYNQVKAEIDSGKAPFKSVTIVYPLRAVDNGQTFNFNSTDFTPEARSYFDGAVTNDLKEQLSRYKDDYHFTFCLHASTNLGADRYWGKHEYAHDLTTKRKEKLREEIDKIFAKPELAPLAGSVHIQAQWTQEEDRHNASTKHFATQLPFGLIMVLGDPKAGKVKTQEEANQEAGGHAEDVDKRRGCEVEDFDELVKKLPEGKVSYTYIDGSDSLPLSRPDDKADWNKGADEPLYNEIVDDPAEPPGNAKNDPIPRNLGLLDQIKSWKFPFW